MNLRFYDPMTSTLIIIGYGVPQDRELQQLRADDLGCAATVRCRQNDPCPLHMFLPAVPIRHNRSRSVALTSMLIPSRMPQNRTAYANMEPYDCVKPLAGFQLFRLQRSNTGWIYS